MRTFIGPCMDLFGFVLYECDSLLWSKSVVFSSLLTDDVGFILIFITRAGGVGLSLIALANSAIQSAKAWVSLYRTF